VAEVKVLRDLDPDDPRTPSQQIANALRAAILMGTFRPGDRLPSQHELSRHYRVARETVKSALQILDREALVVSRQGSGAFVRSRQGTPLDLEGLLRTAFDRPHVSIDYAGFRGETLANTLVPSLREIGAGTHPRLIVYNKADLLENPNGFFTADRDMLLVSAATGVNLDVLVEEIVSRVASSAALPT